MDGDNEIWDEFQWEEFMKEQDKKVDRYMELFYRYKDDPNRDEIIAREMNWPWGKKDEDDEFRIEDEITEEGEEWKSAAGLDNEMEETDLYKNLPAYQMAHEFALSAFRFVEQLPERLGKDSAVVDFLSNAMIVSAKIAGGTGIGDDIEELGGNIAYCKRGLAAANLSIAALYEMKEKKIIEQKRYLELQEQATEVRNALAIHILTLRERFRRGI